MSVAVEEGLVRPEPGSPVVRVEGSLLPDLRRFGAVDVAACFNCGTCSAICPLTGDDGAFPRRLIRFAQLGMRDELLASPELWSCYGCGECTLSCPRQADPAAFMASARRYAVAAYDRTGLARRLATSAPFAAIFITVLVSTLAAFMYTAHRPVDGTEVALFEFLPAGFVHDLGIGVFALFSVATVAGLVEMLRRVLRGPRAKEPTPLAGVLWDTVARDALAHRRFRQECAVEPGEESGADPQRWYLRRWVVHAATMWGFLGLLSATLLDYGLELTGVKATGAEVPVWYPVRLLGTAAGLLLVYGSTVIIVRRLRRSVPTAARSTVADWSFLWLLWLSGVTGFALELALYLPGATSWGYAMMLVHVAIAMALVLLAPFGTFAHAIYRPVGLVASRRAARVGGGR
ncbi:MAG: 4Fe-4S dicluster domain-containing protein [Actinomycetota bacterium]